MTAPSSRGPLNEIQRYQQGKSALPGHEAPLKLSSNESAYGSSDAAREAYVATRDLLHRYPDGSQTALREAIAEVHGLPAEQIVCGNGSEELIGLVVRCYVNAGDEVLLTRNHFVMCPIYARAQGAEVLLAEERDDVVDVDALLRAVTPRTRVVIVANPNNPTGTYAPRADIARLVDALPEDVVLILDGAYAEYVTEEDFDDGATYAVERANVVVTHTFSKIYGLAGLRVGWAVAPPAIIDTINRLRTPFNVSAAALAAATAAMRDQAFVAEARRRNREALDVLLPGIRALGFAVTNSVANFYLIDLSTVAGANTADAVMHLEANGVIPRPAGPDGRLRITVGTPNENQRVLELLAAYRAGLS